MKLRDKSPWMNILGKRFMNRFHAWNDTVYKAGSCRHMTDEQVLKYYGPTIEHELVHIRQQHDLGLFAFAVLYVGPAPFALALGVLLAPFDWRLGLSCLMSAVVLSPLSLGLAYGRWLIEREAYARQAYVAGMDAKEKQMFYVRVVATLSRDHTWPARNMSEWFRRNG